ncbi:lifeguard 4-like [Brachionus plicatilis]|uniref:Lifeguard 4-like n=1 Tax=Brachionus plicatilis TaxID=10195 RepID=A0A3M7QQ32_BRAPC|nr:lifeguard 4-like [Brachionus plicatilis]
MNQDRVIHQEGDPTRSNHSIVDDFMYGSNVAQSHVTIRLGFLRKVYGILFSQLAFTSIVCIFIINSPGFQEILKENPWIMIFNFGVTFALLIGLMINRTNYPMNYYLLALFTFFESISVGLITSFYETWIVVQAFILTSLVVGSLTLYTFQTKRDFKAGGAILSSLLLLLIFGGLFQIFFQNEMMHTLLAILGAFVFSGFIVYDTQMIMKKLSPEEYILGVINLYLDIINLFLEILKILDSMKKN